MGRTSLGVAWVLLASLASGCVRTYRVRPGHLERAELIESTTRSRVAIPARDAVGRETFVSLPTVLRTRPLPGRWLELRRLDARIPLVVSGVLLLGAAFVFARTPGLVSSTSRIQGIESFMTAFALGIPGLSTLSLAIILDGPEVSGPSPGMPASTSQRMPE